MSFQRTLRLGCRKKEHCSRITILDICSVVTKAVDAETETKTEAAGFETEAVYLKAEAQGSWPILLTVLSLGAVLAQKF